MSLSYSTWLSQIQTLVPTTSSDADFASILPGAIDYAEGRIYRDLDLLSTVVSNTSGATTTNYRFFTLPQTSGYIMTIRNINILTPSGSSVLNATRNPLIRTTRDVIDFLWPQNQPIPPLTTTIPTMWAPISDQTILFGSAPGNAYTVEIYGTIRPTALSAGNTTTFLTLHLPELFVAASMIFVSGYLKNFGAQADDPRSAVSWEGQYEKLLASADAEEMRRKFGANLKH